MRHLQLAALIATGLPVAASSADLQVLEAALPGCAGEGPARLELREVDGAVRRGGDRSRPVIDSADYRAAGTLTLPCSAFLRPAPTGSVRIPAGRHEIGFEVPPDGAPPVLLLRTGDGLRLRLPLAATAPPVRHPRHLAARSLAGGGEGSGWPVAIDLPTTSGLLELSASARGAVRPALRREERPRSRSEAIWQVIDERRKRGGADRLRERP